ncbi:MAG: hypothetical protein R3E66_21875 [bacterium]
MSKLGLEIEKGARHCKIVDEAGEVVFRTTNVRDAEHYVQLVEEVERLQRLLEARGMAPHRIYLLAADEDKRGRVNLDSVPANEVVIVAKADDGVVVRHLSDGREEIVDLDELEPIEGGSYLQASEITDESVHVVIRLDRESEAASVAAFRSKEKADTFATDWTRTEEAPGSEYSSVISYAEGDILIYKSEASLED